MTLLCRLTYAQEIFFDKDCVELHTLEKHKYMEYFHIYHERERERERERETEERMTSDRNNVFYAHLL